MNVQNVPKLADGEPCAQPGCASCFTRSCRGCGRVALRGVRFLPGAEMLLAENDVFGSRSHVTILRLTRGDTVVVDTAAGPRGVSYRNLSPA